MPRSKSIFAILMILSFFFNEAQAMFWRKEIVIGYTAVTSDQARDINKNNKLYIQQIRSINPLGDGIYMRNKPEGLANREGTWFCAIKARKWKLKKADKVYIPKFYEPETSDDTLPQEQTSRGGSGRIRLWGKDEKVLVEYIKSQQVLSRLKQTLRWPWGQADEPNKALRFSWVEGRKRQLQMVIPMRVKLS
ncbi:uncharacterized protein L3040_001549 [Drepanopeziza brunnea f. sp. 'multigermtubi']|uniref:uncharacterized protein n=1 Tax=Drepanopeziza brunnea f. sp. 'multigermtubi' TaxID=698441 RepID=UPI00239A776D|nr:hypothetical protein L3040_001549 [Drepanopeziza brunnea f. sp. 'multigermtubi']